MSKKYVMDALRLHLKARNITYKELASALGLSEISVKRLFTSGDCGLRRLAAAGCKAAELACEKRLKT